MLVWQNNSCYLDSLLTIFFFNKDSYFASNIFAKTQYILNFKKVVSVGSEITTKQEYLDFHKSLTKELYNLYKIQETDPTAPISSFETMNILQKAINYLKDDYGKWNPESCALIYNKFIEIYPMMKLKYKILDKDKISDASSCTIEYHNLFKPCTQNIIWDEYDFDIIVFEINTREGCEKIDNFILNDRYELTAIIVLNKAHYSSFIKGINDMWMYYDDTFKNVPTFSELNIEWYKNANMLFYSKIK